MAVLPTAHPLTSKKGEKHVIKTSKIENFNIAYQVLNYQK